MIDCDCILLQVGDHDVECAPEFRLFLHTSTSAHNIPPELAAHVNIIYFHAARPDIEEELLDRFMLHEKSRINDERTALLQVLYNNEMRTGIKNIYLNLNYALIQSILTIIQRGSVLALRSLPKAPGHLNPGTGPQIPTVRWQCVLLADFSI